MVEILRPAQRHTLEAEIVEAPRAGAPFAPFLAQVLSQNQKGRPTTADIADRYETAAALLDEPQRVCIATV